MLRAVVLSLILLVGIGMLIPLATEYAEAGPRKIRKYSKKKKRVRKYSKRWWRSYNRRKKARRARARRARQTRARRARRARARRARARRARLRRARARRARARRARVRRARARRARVRRARVRRARLRRTKRTRVRRNRTARRTNTRTRSTARRTNTRTRSTARRTNAPAQQTPVAAPSAPVAAAPNAPYETRSIIAAQARAIAAPAETPQPAIQIYSPQSAIPNPVVNYPAQTAVPSAPVFIQPRAASAPTQSSRVADSGTAQGELQFGVTSPSGGLIGSASISVVGPAVDEPTIYNRRVKTVGGVATTALRRTVIDQMIKENGWVVNDYQKEIAGQKVYVVVAQSPGANNQIENRMFYFTESEGRIYSVATKAPEKDAELLEEESEKVITSLQRRNTPNTQVASNLERTSEANRTFIGMGNRASNN